mmetsp:Transcript_34414/g.52698  ORF Transcript_34414/g.52698 Transcript_34414/m.52698 type:complete len:320 (-) Transcript_34414:1231-2190(-)
MEQLRFKKNKANLNKWEDYRDTKIELTAIFIKVLKRKNFTRRWLIQHKAGQIYAKIRENLYIRRELDRVLFASYHVAIRFFVAYEYKYKKGYGQEMVTRRKNEIRRALNFGAQVNFVAREKSIREYLARFIFKTFLVFDTCKQFTFKNNNIVFIQRTWLNVQLTRDFKNKLFFKRLEQQKDFFLHFYAKKKSSKKGQRMLKNLKKIFGKSRLEDVNMINAQIQIYSNRTVLETKVLFLSIAIRAMTITNQIMNLSTVKTPEGDKIFKTQVAANRVKIDEMIKQVRALNKRIDICNRDIFGMSEKDIKEVQKKAKGRKPD